MTRREESPIRLSGVRSVYQPIVDLTDRHLVGYEALARLDDGEADLSFNEIAARLAHPDLELDELDWACRTVAFEGALAANLGPDLTLFVNAEPTTSSVDGSTRRQHDVLDRATAGLRVIIEITERSLLAHLDNVVRLTRWARERGWGIAIDDVGVNPHSLAVLPFVEPDVIKLDIALIQRLPGEREAHTLMAVMAQAERHGTVLLAEGVETEQHLEQALSVGATIGQGWLLGRPEPLVTRPSAPGTPLL